MPIIDAKFDVRGSYIGDWYKDLPTAQNPATEEAKISGYFIADMKVTKYMFDGHLQVYGVVSNIFDKYYEIGSGMPGYGRAFLVGSRITF